MAPPSFALAWGTAEMGTKRAFAVTPAGPAKTVGASGADRPQPVNRGRQPHAEHSGQSSHSRRAPPWLASLGLHDRRD